MALPLQDMCFWQRCRMVEVMMLWFRCGTGCPMWHTHFTVLAAPCDTPTLLYWPMWHAHFTVLAHVTHPLYCTGPCDTPTLRYWLPHVTHPLNCTGCPMWHAQFTNIIPNWLQDMCFCQRCQMVEVWMIEWMSTRISWTYLIWVASPSVSRLGMMHSSCCLNYRLQTYRITTT